MAENFVYFLAPMVLADRAAQGLKPFLMDPEDLRGPWECLWHKVSYTVVSAHYETHHKLKLALSLATSFTSNLLTDLCTNVVQR